jgi:molecular chaperone Hsp33
VRALSPAHDLRLALTDVTGPAQELERRHLSGPAASTVLAEALVAASLLTTHLKHPDEALSLQLTVDGPLRGVLAEVWDGGALRGYTQRKLLPEHDGPAVDPSAVLGRSGTLTVLHSSPVKVVYSGTVSATPPDVRLALARWYNQSQQVPAAVAIYTRLDAEAFLARAAGAVAEKLPGGDTERFVEVLERFQDGTVQQALAEGLDVAQLGARIGLPDLQPLETHPLRFACRCSRDKVEQALLVLPREDLAEMVAEDREHEVTCHFCSHPYRLGPAELKALLTERDGWH